MAQAARSLVLTVLTITGFAAHGWSWAACLAQDSDNESAAVAGEAETEAVSARKFGEMVTEKINAAMDFASREGSEPELYVMPETFRPADASDLERFGQLREQLREGLLRSRVTSIEFFSGTLDDSYDTKRDFEKVQKEIQVLAPEFRSLACKIFASEIDQPESLDQLIEPITEDMLANAEMLNLDAALVKLIAAQPENRDLKRELALVYIKTNRFLEGMKIAIDIGPIEASEIENSESQLLRSLPALVAAWEWEQRLRDREQQANDLPRVEMTLPSGKVVIELFENEAPETVGNFISLVESGDFDGKVFHRVISSFMAQGGGFSPGMPPRAPEYSINDEFKRPDFRRHFARSISMANTGQPKSGSKQFFMCFVATPFLDGKHTVFGHVVEGFEHVRRLTPTHEIDKEGKEVPIDAAVADAIISARVLRKRDHEYVTTKADTN